MEPSDKVSTSKVIPTSDCIQKILASLLNRDSAELALYSIFLGSNAVSDYQLVSIECEHDCTQIFTVLLRSWRLPGRTHAQFGFSCAREVQHICESEPSPQ